MLHSISAFDETAQHFLVIYAGAGYRGSSAESFHRHTYTHEPILNLLAVSFLCRVRLERHVCVFYGPSSTVLVAS